jgi:glycosyltransferase involved in cell wall biosynthesis
MTDAWVTVIVPTRRRPAFLVEALDSVRRQTFRAWRCVVAVDGDDPETIGVLNAIEAAEPRISHLVVRDGGSAARVRNAGLARVDTPCVAFLDDDDVWLDDKLARQHAVFVAHPRTVLVCCQVRTFGDQDALWPVGPLPEVLDADLLCAGNEVATSTVVARTADVRAAGGFDPRFVPAEDYDLWLSLTGAGEVRYLGTPLSRYRIHAGGVSRDDWAMLRAIERLLTRHHRRGICSSSRYWSRLRTLYSHRRHLSGSRLGRAWWGLRRWTADLRLSLADAARSSRRRSAGRTRPPDPPRR